MRILCLILYHLVAKHLPRSSARYHYATRWIRYQLCKRLFARCGQDVNVERGADIGTGRGIQIGDNSNIGVDCVVHRAIIGENVLMGPEVVFLDVNHKYADARQLIREQGESESLPITVGDDVWIGMRSIILPGIKIGKGAVVGAGAVVTKDVPEYALIAGNPATVKKYRE